MHPSLVKSGTSAIPVHAVSAKDARAWLARQARSGLVTASGFAGAAGALAALPDARGGIAAWVLGLGDSKDAFALAAAAEKVPAGTYRLGDVPEFCGGANAALAWLMGGYGFDRYKKKTAKAARLVLPPGVDGSEISRIAENLFLARDLVNT
ncbi:MAG: leucyl aminopeptidase family protein, partial [Alphaproteobacteria bacterium]